MTKNPAAQELGRKGGRARHTALDAQGWSDLSRYAWMCREAKRTGKVRLEAFTALPDDLRVRLLARFPTLEMTTVQGP